MAERRFELPGIQELKKEQEDVRALPKKGQHLVIGGPGTGKSVLALLRARRHARAGEPHVFLVFNKLLHEASCHLGGSKISCFQWMAWFFKLFWEIAKKPVPRVAASPGSSWQDINWEGANLILDRQLEGTDSRPEYIIIDEGQDMPPDFYRVLISLRFENFFVVADQHQQIVSGKNSSRRDLEIELGIKHEQVIELKENHRNKYPIARLAREFYTGDIASPEVTLPQDSGGKAKMPLLFTYQNNQFELMINKILKMADREPSKLIGIIAPDNKVRKLFFDALQCGTEKISLDNGSPFIRTYHYDHQEHVNFHEGGIMVINAQACKGLEFEYVFLANIESYFCPSKDQDSLKRLFYVMVARARDQVILLRSSGKRCPADCILPKNTNILKQYP